MTDIYIHLQLTASNHEYFAALSKRYRLHFCFGTSCAGLCFLILKSVVLGSMKVFPALLVLLSFARSYHINAFRIVNRVEFLSKKSFVSPRHSDRLAACFKLRSSHTLSLRQNKLTEDETKCAPNTRSDDANAALSPSTAVSESSNRWRFALSFTVLTALAVAISYADRSNLSTALIPMRAEYNWDATTSGAVLSAFYLGYALTQIAGGWLADAFGGEPVLCAGLVAWSVLTGVLYIC